eukprot:38441_1
MILMDIHHQSYTFPKKYNSLKFEILNNKIYSLNKTQINITITKANKYLYTNKIKTIVAYSLEREDASGPATGIKQGSEILLDNIISILLYTDWTDLSNKFS